MNERELNRIIAKTFNEFHMGPPHDWRGFGYKIPDSSFPKPQGGKRPFDGFAVYMGFTIAWEAKFLRGYQALPFSRFADHQMEYLERVRQPGCQRLGLVIVGINEPHRGTDLFFLDCLLVRSMAGLESGASISQGQNKSIRADSFAQWKSLGLSRPIKKGSFDLAGFPGFVIVK